MVTTLCCALGFQLGINIKETVQAVTEVKSVQVHVGGFVHAERLQKILAEMDCGVN